MGVELAFYAIVAIGSIWLAMVLINKTERQFQKTLKTLAERRGGTYHEPRSFKMSMGDSFSPNVTTARSAHVSMKWEGATIELDYQISTAEYSSGFSRFFWGPLDDGFGFRVCTEGIGGKIVKVFQVQDIQVGDPGWTRPS